jgi:hypothetical protein
MARSTQKPPHVRKETRAPRGAPRGQPRGVARGGRHVRSDGDDGRQAGLSFGFFLCGGAASKVVLEKHSPRFN